MVFEIWTSLYLKLPYNKMLDFQVYLSISIENFYLYFKEKEEKYI